MKKLLFSLFSIFILLAYPLQAIEIDKSMLNDISKNISNDLSVPIIVGKDDRQNITDTATGPERAVVVIDTESGLCSGAMVAPNIVLTAAHCLVNEKGNYSNGAEVFAVSLPSTEDYAPCPYTTTKKLWVPDQYMRATIHHTTTEYPTEKQQFYDYGFIILNTDLGNQTSWLELKVPSNKELKNVNITVIGRGGDKDFISLWKSPGQIGKVTKDYIYHNADVVSGNSGGPIFKDDDPTNIIALHNWEFPNFIFTRRHYPNGGLRIRQEIIDALKNLEKEISETTQK